MDTGRVSDAACSNDSFTPNCCTTSSSSRPDVVRGNATARAAESPMASTRYGGSSGRKSTRIAAPADRIAVVEVSRTPLTAMASAPEAHSAFTAFCTSVSRTRPGSSVAAGSLPSAESSTTTSPGPCTAV